MFIEETLRRHGLGDATGRCRCSTCSKTLNVEDEVEGSVVAQDERAFRCLSCGDFLECSKCCLERHGRVPLHFIEVCEDLAIWRNGSWERTTLRELGLVYQIGHQEAPCTYPDATPRLMTVLHITGVHTVAYRYCDCGLSDGLHKWQQLLRTNWYPATTHVPSTCVTMEMLSLYRRLKGHRNG
ncbi:hypothetical protein BDZ89DRAFT_961642 [Hymenopellis radicata]|nr:hypothetical protein BDZ89DRAFT_961642 [Hymenopellis radicata]